MQERANGDRVGQDAHEDDKEREPAADEVLASEQEIDFFAAIVENVVESGGTNGVVEFGRSRSRSRRHHRRHLVFP